MTTVPEPARHLRVAAPPWAGKALGDVAAILGPGVVVEHVSVGGDAPDPGARASGVEVLWRYHLRPDQLPAALAPLPDVRWVHSDYVGVDDLDLAALAARGVVLTNGAGISARPMAEWVLLATLIASKQVLRLVRQSDAGEWDPGGPSRGLEGATVLLLGLGAVGGLAAPWLDAMGATVVAVTRRPRPGPVAGVSRLVTSERWRRELPGADHVVLALPLTSATAAMMDDAAFGAMRPGAWLVNVARGGLVDESALLAALDDGRLGGAVLDAFVQEPLPPDHPLWRRPNVLVLPHATWSSPDIRSRFATHFANQLRRWSENRPLEDVVDLVAGY